MKVYTSRNQQPYARCAQVVHQVESRAAETLVVLLPVWTTGSYLVRDHQRHVVGLRFFFSSRRRHTRLQGDWSSDVCSSDLAPRSKTQGAASAKPAKPPEYWPPSNWTRAIG